MNRISLFLPEEPMKPIRTSTAFSRLSSTHPGSYSGPEDMDKPMSIRVKSLLTFADEDRALLRACPVQHVLHRGGDILENSEGSDWSYELSHEVDHIDEFISHNWSVGRWLKWCVLAYHYNRKKATIVCLTASLIGCTLTAYDMLPVWTDEEHRKIGGYGYLGAFLLTPLFLCVIGFGHELQWLTSYTTCKVFLDKTCIHQTDDALKLEGIKKLGSLIGVSRHMVICYTDVYVQRLWTVYEIACFLCTHDIEAMTLLHTRWIIFCAFGLIAFYIEYLFEFLTIFFSGYAWLTMLFRIPLIFCANFLSRYLIKDLEQTRRRISNFSVQKAMCSSEIDRPLVYGNISLLLKHYGIITKSASEQEALDLFNNMVRANLPIALQRLSGRTGGVPYITVACVLIPSAGREIMDFLSIIMRRHGFFSLQTVLAAFDIFIYTFLISPCFVQTWARVQKKCLDLDGWKENLYVVLMAIVTTALLQAVALVVGPLLIGPNMYPDSTDGMYGTVSIPWVIAFVLYGFCWMAYACVVFGVFERWLRNPIQDQRIETALNRSFDLSCAEPLQLCAAAAALSKDNPQIQLEDPATLIMKVDSFSSLPTTSSASLLKDHAQLHQEDHTALIGVDRTALTGVDPRVVGAQESPAECSVSLSVSESLNPPVQIVKKKGPSQKSRVKSKSKVKLSKVIVERRSDA